MLFVSLSLPGSEICPLGHVPQIQTPSQARDLILFSFHSWITKQQAVSDSRTLGHTCSFWAHSCFLWAAQELSGPSGRLQAYSSHLLSLSSGIQGNILKELFSLPVCGTGLPQANNFRPSISHPQCWQRGQHTTFSSCWWEFQWIQISTDQIGPCAPKDLDVCNFWPSNSFSRNFPEKIIRQVYKDICKTWFIRGLLKKE